MSQENYQVQIALAQPTKNSPIKPLVVVAIDLPLDFSEDSLQLLNDNKEKINQAFLQLFGDKRGLDKISNEELALKTEGIKTVLALLKLYERISNGKASLNSITKFNSANGNELMIVDYHNPEPTKKVS